MVQTTQPSANVFHPLGLALTREGKSEDFEFVFQSFKLGLDRFGYPSLKHVDLLADAADAITNGFDKAFKQDTFKRGIFFLKFDWFL